MMRVFTLNVDGVAEKLRRQFVPQQKGKPFRTPYTNCACNFAEMFLMQYTF